MKKPLFFCLLAMLSVPAFAQLDNTMFEDRMVMTDADTGRLFVGLNLLGFVRNNEFFDTIVEGYTLLGYQLNPYLSYSFSGNVRLDAGVYGQKDFGTRNYSTIVPTLSLKLKQGNFNFIFGNLEGCLNHRLIEPLYDFERVLNNRLETGIQTQWILDGLFLDVWLDWQRMIYNNDPGQEKFTAGLSFKKTIINSGWKISVPVQAVVSHKGGQINYNPPPLETQYNTAIGAEAERDFLGVIKTFMIDGFYVYYKNPSSVLVRPYQDGDGIYINANVKSRFGLDVMASYWAGSEYLSVEGGLIYPSVSEFDYRSQSEKRQLLILRFLYQKKIADGLNGSFRVEPHYDIGFGSLQYSYGLYLQFNDRFFMTEGKRR